MIETNQRSDGLVYFTGGVCALILGLAYVIIIALYAPIGAPPIRVDARLTYLAANATRWWWIIGLSVLTDFLFVPLTVSNYFALKEANRYLILLASACIMLFVCLDLAITWTNYTSLMTLSGAYARAATEIQRANLLAAAGASAAVLQSSLLFVYNTLTLAVGILVSGLVMLRGVFGKPAAYMGIATGFVGIVSVTGSLFISGFSIAIILASCLTTLWVVVVGWNLCILGARVRLASAAR